jgi:DNA-binding NarL/FixJ family response regulator
MIASLANVAYALGLLPLFRSRIPEARVRRLTLSFFILSALFSPGIACDILASRDIRLLSALSIAIAVLALRYLATGSVSVEPRTFEDARMSELAVERGLTSREGEIMALVARGMSNKQVARELGISDRTVGNHVYSLYRKPGINSRFELMGIIHGRGARGPGGPGMRG